MILSITKIRHTHAAAATTTTTTGLLSSHILAFTTKSSSPYPEEPHTFRQVGSKNRRRRKFQTPDTLHQMVKDLKKKDNSIRLEYGAFVMESSSSSSSSSEKKNKRVWSGRGMAWKKASASKTVLGSSAMEDSSTVVEKEEEEEVKEIHFPLKGKKLEDVAPRMRFAPSPTGSLHVGGARTALYNWLVAKRGQLDQPNSNGGFILRVEDTDLARSTKESEESVLADLSWLGLHWDEGPNKTPQPPHSSNYGPYRQSERSTLYQTAAQILLSQNKAYPCFCTQEELDSMKATQEANGQPTRYDNTWRDADPELVKQKLSNNEPHTIRFKVPSGARIVIDDAVRGTVSWDAESTVGDFILLRSNGVPVYNFCVAVDDATMGISTVIRAEEHLTNTLRQGLILDALGAPRPRYAHCSLILGEDKQKLSKRHGATSCDQYRVDGFLPDAMINYLALLGWNDGSDNEIYTRDELIEAFDVDRIVKSPSVFDLDKLKWVNSQHIKMMSVDDLKPLVSQQIGFLGLWRDDVDVVDQDGSRRDMVAFAATSLAKQMMETTRDAATNAHTVLAYGLPDSFQHLPDGSEAKEMIKKGHFYSLASAIVQDFQKGQFPLPDPKQPLDAFLLNVQQESSSSSSKKEEQEEEEEDTSYSYPKAYKTYTKVLSRALKLKGKNFFHPLRLALTGEMSGQDVTKQLSLLELVFQNDSNDTGSINITKANAVSTSQRFERLNAFLETIPQEFRSPPPKSDKNKDASKKQPKQQQQTESKSSQTPTMNDNKTKEDPLSTYKGPPITALDIRVGRIIKIWEHPEADKLYCEEIDIGETNDDETNTPKTRMIASGLKPYYTNPNELQNRLVLVLSNLKSRKLLGFPSHGMVLCASNSDHSNVRIINPPVDAKVGERVTVPGIEFDNDDGEPFGENKIGKKKVLEALGPFLKTDMYGIPGFMGRPFMTSGGVCTSSIPDGDVS